MRRSVEDIEVLRRHVTRLIESAILFQDALLTYQMEVYEPTMKEPFCFKCGDPIERRSWGSKPWTCENCKKGWTRPEHEYQYQKTTQ